MVNFTKFTTQELEEMLEERESRIYALTLLDNIDQELDEIEIIKNIILERKTQGN